MTCEDHPTSGEDGRYGFLLQASEMTKQGADPQAAGYAHVRGVEHRWKYDPDHYAAAAGSLDSPSGMAILSKSRYREVVVLNNA